MKFLLNKYREELKSKPILKSVHNELYVHDIDQIFGFEISHKVSGSLVFCLVDNDINSLAGYISLVDNEAIPFLLSGRIDDKNLLGLIEAYKPAYLWLKHSKYPHVSGSIIVYTLGEYCLLELKKTNYEIHSNLGLLIPTSGSTGSPKVIRLSRNNLLSNAISIASYLSLDTNEIPITTLPPSYTYGLSIIHSHLLVGSTIAVTEKTFFDREFWDFIRSVEATSFGGVPYHYEILKKLHFTKMNIPSLRTLTQAGGRMAPELSQFFGEYCNSRGISYYTMYGQAEATARMSYLSPEKAITKAGSIGRAIPDGKLWLEDDFGNVIDQEQVIGELVYKGPNVSMGYAYSFNDLSLGDERGGILRTGDMAKFDKDGDFYIVGRRKRFIKLFGHRINLVDVENYINSTGYTVACSGDDDLLEVYAVDIDKQQATYIKKNVVDFLKTAVSGVSIYLIEAFPRNEYGKIQYSKLKSEPATRLA
jgi:long-chain acyl-CoA synthetase